MGLLRAIRTMCRKVGYDIARFDTANPLVRRRQLFNTYQIDTVLDVGANAGFYALELRRDVEYRGRIVSFEPLSEAFAALDVVAAGDPKWTVHRCALGDAAGRYDINVSANSCSSSILPGLPALASKAPEAKYVRKESIEVMTLDQVFASVCGDSTSIYMKLDTQGFESRVLRGAAQSLPRIDTIQIEMSLVPLYDGELLFEEMCAVLNSSGYALVGLEPGFTEAHSGQLLQVDGIFHRG